MVLHRDNLMFVDTKSASNGHNPDSPLFDTFGKTDQEATVSAGSTMSGTGKLSEGRSYVITAKNRFSWDVDLSPVIVKIKSFFKDLADWLEQERDYPLTGTALVVIVSCIVSFAAVMFTVNYMGQKDRMYMDGERYEVVGVAQVPGHQDLLIPIYRRSQ